jgi:5,10-methylenetetrahydromethanopterin reductase
MRIGLQGGVTGRGDNAIEELLESARRAADAGLDLWIGQLTDVDALTALAVVGHQVPGLRFGTAVVPTYPRHPLVMASQALTVQAASGGALTLGIGLSHRVVIEGAYGLSFDKPLRHMREYLEILMPVLETGAVSFEGQELTARTFAPVRVAGAQPPPVVVAALGTQMLRLAGRLADGTALWMVGPKTVGGHIVPTITAAASAAGRPAPRVVVGLPVSVTSDPDGARDDAARLYALYDQLPSYRTMLDMEGAGGPADVAVVGDEETVATQVRHFAEIGATDFTAVAFGSTEDKARTLALLAELAKA